MRDSPDRRSWVTRVGMEWQEVKQEKWTGPGCCQDPRVLATPNEPWSGVDLHHGEACAGQ